MVGSGGCRQVSGSCKYLESYSYHHLEPSGKPNLKGFRVWGFMGNYTSRHGVAGILISPSGTFATLGIYQAH